MSGKFSISAIFKARDMLSGPIGKVSKSFQKMAKNVGASVREMNSGLDKALEGIQRVGAAAAVVGAGAATGLFLAGKRGAEFEQAMASVGAVSLATREEVSALTKEAKRLATVTKFSATEVAAGMELMGRAGFTNEQVLAGIGPMLSAAAAEGAEFAEVANHVSNILKGMGFDTTAEETQRVADVLTLASARTNSSISSLGESMKNVAPVARQFKVSFEDSVAAVALLQDVGIDASEAGTSVATMLTKLAKPSKEAAAEMTALGIKFQDAKGNMLPLTEVFAQFEQASKKAGGNMKQAAFFAELVGLRGQKAAINLKDLFAKGKFTELQKELAGAQGSAKKMADLRMDNLVDQLKLLGNIVDVVAIEIFDLGSAGLGEIVKKTQEWVAANKDLIVSGVKEFLADVKAALPEIMVWADRVGKFVTVWLAYAAAVKAAAAAQALFTAIAAANPITLIVLAIVAAVSLLYAFWPEVSAFFGKVWKAISELATRIGSAVGNALASAWATLKTYAIAVAEFIAGVVTILLAQVPIIGKLFTAFAAGARWVIAAWGFVAPYFLELWEAIKGYVGSAYEWIATMTTFAVDKVKGVWEPISTFFSNLWEGIKKSVMGAIDKILGKISSFIAAVRKIGRTGIGDLFGGDDAPEPPGGGVGAGYGPPAAPSIVSPQVAPPNATPVSFRSGEDNDLGTGTIRVESAPGSKAKVVQQPKGGRIRLTPSGTFRPQPVAT